MKKLIAFLVFAIAAICANAQTFEYEGLNYNILSEADKTCEVAAYQNASGDITIPGTVTYDNSQYTVTSIGDYAFYSCSSLASITLPESLTSIGIGAFASCSSLSSITLPGSVTTIENSAFNSCTSLTEINVAAENKNYASIDGVLFSKDLTVLITCPAGKSGEYTVPNGVTSIGDYAFSWCSRLTSITLPESLTSIGDYAFSWCSRLTSITLPESLTSIGNGTFAHCESLTEITLPGSVTTIGNSAFNSCTSLTEINVAAENKNYASIDGVLFSKDLTVLITCPGGKSGEYTVPNGVTSIGDIAFFSCKSLAEITLPESINSIGDYAFTYCSSLTSITLPKGITSIGDYAFSSCKSLTSITLPESLNSIGNEAFNSCTSLIEITLPESLTSIGSGAFVDCRSLTSITLPKGLTSIGNEAFWRCYSLISITLPESLTSIGDYAFTYCSSLTSINVAAENKIYASIDGVLFSKDLTVLIVYPAGKSSVYIIPNGVTSIGNYAFYRCESLAEITLPESINSIENMAFAWCSSLATVNSYATNPPVCDGNWVFSAIPSDAVLHVPVGFRDDYVTATGWSVFNTIIDDLIATSGVDEIELDTKTGDADDFIVVYNLQGHRMNISSRSELPTLPAGIYIINGKKVLIK